MHTEQIHSIEGELKGYETELYAASSEYKTLAQDAAAKRATYDVAYATEFLKSKTGGEKVTDKMAESLTVVAVQHQLTAARIAEALADASKRRMTAIQSNLTSVQTRASLLRTERSLVNMMS